MLPDPLLVPIANQAFVDALLAAATSVSLTSYSLPRLTNDGLASKYLYAVPGTSFKHALSINHSETNEFKPFTTQRTLIRRDISVVNAITGKPVVLSAYMVVALPQSDDFTVANAVDLARAVAALVLLGPPSGGTVQGTDDSTLTRILNLES